jgi:hypothetical protein
MWSFFLMISMFILTLADGLSSTWFMLAYLSRVGAVPEEKGLAL